MGKLPKQQESNGGSPLCAAALDGYSADYWQDRFDLLERWLIPVNGILP